MKQFRLGDIAKCCCGRMVNGDPAAEVHSVAIDDRKVQPGDLFVPIKGERFDGHEFISRAFGAGAVATLTERELEGSQPYILVDSTLDAFQAIAEYYKSLFPIKTVGITGSVGKTTTKEMIWSVLSRQFRTLKSEGNLNNQTGVPLTVMRLDNTYQAAVIEMGTNHFGEIASLAKVVRPDFCVITNIGTAHIEHLKSRDGILRAKTEMLAYMKEGGRVLVNGDDDKLITLKKSRRDVFTFGLENYNDLYAEDLKPQGLEGTRFTAVWQGGREELFVPAPGTHMVYNALCAMAVGLFMGMPVSEIREGIQAYAPLPGRMLLEKANGLTILNDVYNANPASMKAAIDVLRYAEGRKVCILGDMLELGQDSAHFHRVVGAYAADKGIDLILCVGSMAEEIYREALAHGGNAFYFADAEDDALYNLIRPGDTVLVKASRVMALERAVARLKAEKVRD